MSELELKNPCDICFLKDNDCIQDKVKVCLLQKQYQSDPEVVDKLQEQIGLEQLHATSLISEIIQLKAELKETESEADKWLEYSKELVRRSNEKDAEITRLKEDKKQIADWIHLHSYRINNEPARVEFSFLDWQSLIGE
jgi:vacuolar-type H+-ATPase subunit I/STV1